MQKRTMEIGGRACTVYGEAHAPCQILQPVDDHDLEGLDHETALIRELTGREDFCLTAFRIQDWNRDLTPWSAPPVYGTEGFGDGAMQTLSFILQELLPDQKRAQDEKFYLAGYSLAGFFALWAAYQTDLFCGIAAASPSVWYPGWSDYASEHSCRADRVYLSLGDKEEKAGPPIMRTVGDGIRKQYDLLSGQGTRCTLEWNKGNHFREPDVRTAKGIAWLLK